MVVSARLTPQYEPVDVLFTIDLAQLYEVLALRPAFFGPSVQFRQHIKGIDGCIAFLMAGQIPVCCLVLPK